MNETQASISKWANETFGPSGTNMRIAARANEEMAELLRALSVDDNNQQALDECADVVIVLCRLVERLGGDFGELVDAKMVINRAREWNKDGSGHGYHVRKKGQ
jgi:NTP pyrophosphatase (non-canonical NTP hydrolase)